MKEEGRGRRARAATARRRHRQGAPGSSKPCAHSSIAKATQPRPRSSPRMPSCSTIPIFSRSPTPRSPRARAPRSPGKTRSRLTPSASPLCAIELLAQRANDLRDVGLRVLRIAHRGQARGARHIPQGRSSSPRISRRRTPPPWSAARSWVSHGARRRDLARRHSRALARHPGAGRHRSRARSNRQRHARDSRRQQGHAAAESAAGGDRSASASAQIAPRSAAQGRSRPRARAGRRPPTANTSKSSRTSAGSKTPSRSRSSAAKASACCARSFCSWNAPRRPAKTSSSSNYKAIALRRRRGAPRHHPHARRRRRQAARLPADSEGRQSVPRRTRHSRRARSAGNPAHAASRDSARFGRSGSCSVMFPMIATMQELRDAKAVLAEEAARSASPRCRAASWWKCRPWRSWPQASPRRPTSSPSARTISRNTRSRWIAVIRSSRRKSMR